MSRGDGPGKDRGIRRPGRAAGQVGGAVERRLRRRRTRRRRRRAGADVREREVVHQDIQVQRPVGADIPGGVDGRPPDLPAQVVQVHRPGGAAPEHGVQPIEGQTLEGALPHRHISHDLQAGPRIHADHAPGEPSGQRGEAGEPGGGERVHVDVGRRAAE